MKDKIEAGILKAIIYAGIFGWPLLEDEIWQRIETKISKNKLPELLENLVAEGKIDKEDEYYFLKGRNNLAKKRIKSKPVYLEKMAKAKKAAKILKILPTVELVGISGGLAVGNVQDKDDIDFFIVAKAGTLWLTRFAATAILDITNLRRKPGEKQTKDKICLNMFVDTDGLAIPESERDIFTAHEVVQMQPLWDRRVYKNFIQENLWILKFFANIQFKREKSNMVKTRKANLLEKTACYLQKKYMENRLTKEKIEKHRIVFHPKDRRMAVLKKFGQELKKHEV